MLGLDLLGAARYKKVAVKNFPRNFALGVFSSTFGDARPVVDAILKTGKCPRVRVQLLWRDKHDFSTKHFVEAKKEFKKWFGLMAKYPAVDWQISPFCEHNLNRADAQRLATELLAMHKDFTYVNTPWRGSTISGNRILNEIHGHAANPLKGDHQYSFDGSHCFDYDVEDIKERFSSAKTFFFWFAQCNGRKSEKDTTPRPERKAWPTPELIQSAVALSRTKDKVIPYKKGIYKSHSDQHVVPPAPRELKPVFVIPEKGKCITLKTVDGKKIADAPYFGPFSGGGHRYYLNEWGYKVAIKAIKLSGRSAVQVELDGKTLGTIDPAFRDWKYR